MQRLLVIVALGISVVACSSHDEEYEHSHGSYPRRDLCSEQLTCDTCTPVMGCGWCQLENGKGKCASGPSACGATFRWNWEPEACPVTPKVDAGASDVPIASDAAPEAESDAAPAETATESDAAPAETESDAAEETAADAGTETAAPDAAPTCKTAAIPSGCVQSFGGTLCGTGKYTLGCSSTAVPAGCTKALTEGSTTHYCCPCE